MYRILMGKSEGKTPLGRRRRRWVGDIKMDIREIGWGGMDWINLDEDRDQRMTLVNTEVNLRVPQLAASQEVLSFMKLASYVGCCPMFVEDRPPIEGAVKWREPLRRTEIEEVKVRDK
jgi:hypothetical protein